MPAHPGLRLCSWRSGNWTGIGAGRSDGRVPAGPGAAPGHCLGDDEHRAPARGVEGEAPEGHRAAARDPDAVFGVGRAEQAADLLLAHGEPVLAGGQGDPGRLAPGDRAIAPADPGQGTEPGNLASRSPGSGTGTVRTVSAAAASQRPVTATQPATIGMCRARHKQPPDRANPGTVPVSSSMLS